MLTNSESRTIDHATKLHTGKNVNARRMVGAKSRAGGVLRRNHFTQTEPSKGFALAVGERAGQVQYAVKVGKRTLAVVSRRSQAESLAAQNQGYISIL